MIKSLLVALVWQTHCFPTLPHGNTIPLLSIPENVNNEIDCNLHSFAGNILCVSDQFETMGPKVEDFLFLTTSQVKDRVINDYSELDLRRFLEEIPQFYKYKSTIFTDLGK